MQAFENGSTMLELHAPGLQASFLAYVMGDEDYPEIDHASLSSWRQELVKGGHLRRYVDRLRTLYATGENLEGTYLACPLCPMPLCGVGLDDPERAEGSCAHAIEHLSVYRRHQGAPVTATASV
jgi:hypothetical protein